MPLLRSYLFAPGNHPGLLEKVFRTEADAVVLDLEDAVPESEKPQARRLVAAALAPRSRTGGSATAPAAFVRINCVGSPHWRADLDAVVGPAIRGIRVPKTESVESLCRVHDALTDREKALGLAPGLVTVVATIESARGLHQLESLIRAPRLSGFTFGAADFCADISADPCDVESTLFACSRLVVASRSGRLARPVASVFTNLDDVEALRRDTERQKGLGFFGRSAIHPRQVGVINQVFTPTQTEIAGAREIVSAYEAAERRGSGVTRIGGQFVDLAVVRRARGTLALKERALKEQR